MAKVVTPAVPSIGPHNGIADPAVRQAVRALADTHETRNGETPQGFVTREEMRQFVSGVDSSIIRIVDVVESARQMAASPPPGYSKGKLQQDLSNGVKSVLAGVGGDYVLNIDTIANAIVISHKDVVYGGTSLTPGPGLSAIGLTANGIAMGYNDPTTGVWKDAVSIDANTGTATFSGSVNATSGNFSESITVGNTGLTLGDLGSGGYTKAQLNEDLAEGVDSILAGSGGDYTLSVDAVANAIILAHKNAVYRGTATIPGAGRTAIGITAAGIAMGYNDQTTGVWQDAVAIDATGNVTIRGTLKAESVIETSATVGGVQVGDIASQASSAYTTTQNLGDLATQDTISLETQVTGSLASGKVSGLGALALLNSVNLGSQTTGSLGVGSVSGLGALATQSSVNGATQVTNLGDLAYANSIAANQIGAGEIAAGVIYSGRLYTGGYVHAYGSNPSAVLLQGTNIYPTVYGTSSVFSGAGVIGRCTSGSGYGVLALADGVSAGVYAHHSGSGQALYAQNTSNGYAALLQGGSAHALYVSGTMGISNTTMVTNMNAQYLQGKTPANFVDAASGTAYNSTRLAGRFDYQYCQYLSADGGGVITPNSSNQGFHFWTSFAGFDFYASGTSMELRNTSDRRIKRDIEPETLGLDFIKALQPVTYRRLQGERKFHGFIAQDVHSLSGLTPDDSMRVIHSDGVYGTDYISMIAPLVKAVQELSETVNQLKDQVNAA